MADDNNIETRVIAGNGDICLVVGQQPALKLVVSSTVLSKASKVFAALFGPHFREGQRTEHDSQPREVDLHDDEAEPMSQMCHLLHGEQVKSFLAVTSSTNILQFAITVDKYDCVDALHAYSQAILLRTLMFTATTDLLQNGQMMVAAYLLNNDCAFKYVTSSLIGNCTKDYIALLSKPWSSHLPPIILCKFASLKPLLVGPLKTSKCCRRFGGEAC
jgi:hypothetical protein